MSDVKLGEIIITPQRRDAIHIAVAPVVAWEQLTPGVRVGLLEDGRAIFARGNAPSIGIVDPFLRNAVEEGQRFWLVLHPGTVTGLRHEWTHPAFDESAEKSQSETWLRNFAEAADEYLKSGKSYCFGDDIDYSTNFEEFWEHYRNVTGKTGRGEFFRCAC